MPALPPVLMRRTAINPLICSNCGRNLGSVVGPCPSCGASSTVFSGDKTATGGPFEETITGFEPPPLGSEDADAATAGGTTEPAAAAAISFADGAHGSLAVDADFSGPLLLGQNFGRRYHIVRLLGVGGMGAVYQAWDAELGVLVALKVIRPEAAADPLAVQALQRRFKQELLLARQVTHKNVVRIHDLGEIDGIKYITMPYIAGEDLASVLRREGRLPVRRTLKIARSMVSGLAAAHAAGVVHRDLKPANIMVNADDEALIMDFGIARSVGATVPALGTGALNLPTRASGAQTVHGAVIGTIEYMAPEQARADEVDHRADIYAFGLILYDLLLGRARARRTDSGIAELTLRMKKAPPAPRSADSTIPEALDRIVMRCIQPDANARFATTADLVAEFDRLDDEGKPLPIVRRLTKRMAAAAIGVFLGLLALTWWLARGPAVVPVHDPVSILIADFDNVAQDKAFDGALEGALGIALEGAPFITSYDRISARKVASRTGGSKTAGTKLDEPTSRLVAVREGITVVLAGAIAPAGRGYRITVKGQNPDGTELWTQSASARDRSDVLAAIGRVAADIRKALGDTASKRNQLAESESVTTGSLEAVQSYTVAQDLYAAGKFEEAVKYFRASIGQDATFGRAYAGLANALFFMGRKEEAEQHWKKALSLMDRMTDREKYRTQGTYFFAIARNYEKAIDNYEMLTRQYPTDSSGLNNLAIAYFLMLNFPKALEAGRRTLQLYPKNVIFRNNYALYAMYAGDFETATRESEPLIRDPGDTPFFKIYLPPAIATVMNNQYDATAAAYAAMAKAGPEGASLAATGLADLAAYRGRYQEAEDILRAGIEADTQAGNTAGVAAKRIVLAETYAATGRMPLALRTVEDALKLGRSESILVPAARLYVQAGKTGEASELAAELDNRLQTQSRAYAKIIDGNIALLSRRRASALDAFRDAIKLADFWMARFDMGVTYIQAGAWAEAISELDAANRRRGEATAIFLDDTPSVRYLATLPYWLARAQDGIGQRAAALANYKQFLAIRAAALPNDPLVIDARTRSGS
jgi:eukaryotic-like serine/threonine-protein kinase